jgi:hypothetical protein
MSRMVLALVLMSALLAAAPFVALADGDSRAATPAESDFHQKVQSVLDQALPPVPQGWTPGDRTAITPLKYVSTGIGKDPMGVEFHFEARDQQKIDEAQQKAGVVYETLGKSYGAESQKITAEVQKKMADLSKQMEDAINKGDMATFQSLTKELEAAQAPAKALGDAMNKELSEKMAVIRAKDAHLRATLRINAYDLRLDAFAAENPVAGYPAYWKTYPPDQQDEFEGEWLVFAGAWKSIDQDGTPTMTPAWNLALPHTTAQNLLVIVRSDKGRGRRFLESITWDRIAGLLATP